MYGFWIYQGHEYASGSKYTRVLTKPGFWICQVSEYTKVLNTRLVMNLPGFWILIWFWICQGSEYVRVTQGSEYAWLCLAEYGYVWICWDMREYAKICLNSLCFIFPHCNSLSTLRRGYLFQRFHKTRSFSLNENEAVFLEKHNLI